MVSTYPIRPSKNFYELIRFIEGKAILEGKKKPTHKFITEQIANKIDKYELWESINEKII